MTAVGTTTGVSPKSLLRVVAIAEAITWALLIGGMLAAYVFDAGRLGIRIGGGLHGFVFLAYLATAVVVAVNQRWNAGVTLAVLASSIVPFATVPVDVWLDRSGRLEGGWRRTATDDPRDARLPSRVLRLLLARPLVSLLVAVVVVAAVFGALLVVGPPGS